MMDGTCLLIRLGAMGDILHALPAAASLKQSFKHVRLCWVVKKRWIPLLAGNPFIDEIVPFERSSGRELWRSLKSLRSKDAGTAIDLQGLIQSALIARTAGANTVWGFDRLFLREPLAAFFYTERATTPGPHRVTKNLQLVQAAGAHAITDQAWIPQGRMEGQLPKEPFVLTNPVAGWTGKQWPLSSYRELGQRLSKEGIPLVVNVPENEADRFVGDPAWSVHVSSLEGLISATRQASAIIGVDSGPLHLAAALHKPGVAIFGPTDPAANGPYGGTLTTLRAQDAETTYRRQSVVHSSMESITCEDVFQALMQQLQSPDGAPSRVPLGRTL